MSEVNAYGHWVNPFTAAQMYIADQSILRKRTTCRHQWMKLPNGIAVCQSCLMYQDQRTHVLYI